ncbi:PAS domain-containing sensor histidine kinase [Paludisphaera mucosa]|uniref:histidine kinase n=1 Tax=Paludisphaera mucosa TaxID=3030827 RepID=A0ABT6FJA4_9BACT|nr:PAS domain-containing sensor histidine kinase [Paludisphaera mucosa]MDG3007656.1 PAS domain-containing sensor histidine kinase [Paludisphaera mucosa]
MTDDRDGRPSRAKSSLEFTEGVIETAREPMVVLDGRLRVLAANRHFYRTFAVAPEDAAGRLIFELDGGRWNIPRLRTLLKEVLPRDRAFQNLEVDLAYEDGGRRLLINAGKIWREDDHSELILLAVEDLAGRSRPDESLPPAAPEPTREDAGGGTGEFLTMLAHEMRTPIAAIRNAVAVAALTGDGEDVRWCYDIIRRQALKLGILVEDLLDAGRIQRGKLTLRKEPVDAAAVIHRAVETVRPLVAAKNHEVLVTAGPADLHVHADPTRLEQILVNLLSNAVKYTPPDGHIHLDAGSDGGEVTIRVRDDGMGISPEMLSRIFDPFIQADHTLAHAEDGLGIGLAVAKSLAELHGGAIAAMSRGPGGGSEFVVRLPVSDDPKAEAAGLRPPPIPGGSATPLS